MDYLDVQENILEFKVISVQFDRVRLSAITQDLLQTFIGVDFYNHDTKHTDTVQGFDCNFETLFEFRNVVDDFYLNFVSQQCI